MLAAAAVVGTDGASSDAADLARALALSPLQGAIEGGKA
jgi:hypothetical protein